ncbi:MAG: hypothetical protein HY074_14010 [Deltaproteobacteria bacterium]|nr:hypothetical protein [Deltaproteobacteria bacterium]
MCAAKQIAAAAKVIADDTAVRIYGDILLDPKSTAAERQTAAAATDWRLHQLRAIVGDSDIGRTLDLLDTVATRYLGARLKICANSNNVEPGPGNVCYTTDLKTLAAHTPEPDDLLEYELHMKKPKTEQEFVDEKLAHDPVCGKAGIADSSIADSKATKIVSNPVGKPTATISSGMTPVN